MRILSLDYHPLFGADNVSRSFSSDVSVFDFDVVIWDPAGSMNRYYSSETYRGLPCYSDDESVRLMSDAARRRSEFKEFVESGKTLILICRQPQSVYVGTGETQFSGTGKNARKTRMVGSFELISATLPLADPGFEKASGNRIEVLGEGPLQTLMRTHKNSLTYSATMASPPGTVIARVAGTSRAVASRLLYKTGGLILLLPDTAYEAQESGDDEEHEIWPEAAVAWQAGIVEAITALTGQTESIRPAWAENYGTPALMELRQGVVKQRLAVQRARAKLSQLQGKVESSLEREQLFVGTGRPLELQVKAVLEAIGGVVSDAEPGRDDWRVEFPEGHAVVEVKGVGKSAAEKHAAQLEKWVAAGFEETGSLPKGILVVATWRDVPLVDRTQDDFPPQMLPYSEGRGHCLLTGLDLFVIAEDVEKKPERAEFWRKQLMETIGRLQDVPDWRSVILGPQPTAESPDEAT